MKSNSLIKKIIMKITGLKKRYSYFLLRKIKKAKRAIISEKHTNSYTFALTIVKRIEYVDLAINNINSLHLLNPSHKFIAYCDEKCYRHLNNSLFKLDYPRQIKLIGPYGDGKQPWQH